MFQRTTEQDDGTLRVDWTGRVTRAGCRRIGIPEHEDLDGRRIGLNLRGLDWVSPFGLIFLYWYIRDLVDRHDVEKVIVAEPANSDVANYLCRMHVPEAFADDHHVDMKELEERSIRERDLSSQLVELETLRVDHDKEVHRQTERLMEVILRQADVADARKDDLWLTLAEVLSNIQVHSGTQKAALAVQSYENKLRLAFGDGGAGIPARLGDHEEVPENPTDADIIRTAMKRTVTSRPDMGGTGLSDLREIALDSGSLAIRSGDGQVRVYESDGQPRDDHRTDCGRISGTLVGVVLSAE